MREELRKTGLIEINESVEMETGADRPVLAFDLFLEYQRLQEEGLSETLKSTRFFENARTYKMEEYGVSYAGFPPYLIRKNDVEKRELFADGYNGPIREVYRPNNSDFQWPEERLRGINLERAWIEYEAFCEFEKSNGFQNAQNGELFIWISMPPTQILEDQSLSLEKKALLLQNLGYGFHTNVMVFEAGEDFLQGRVLPNYFNAEGNTELLQRLGIVSELGDNPRDTDFLRQVFPLNNSEISSAHDIREVMDGMSEYEVELPKEFRERERLSEEEMDRLLTKVQPFLEQLRILLTEMDSDDFDNVEVLQLTEKKLRVWENSLAALISGEKVGFAEVEKLGTEELAELTLRQLREARELGRLRDNGRLYLEWTILPKMQELDPGMVLAAGAMEEIAESGYYQPAATGCGMGGGFGALGSRSIDSLLNSAQELLRSKLETTDLALTYRNVEGKKENYWHKGDCVKCESKNVDVGPCSICRYCEAEFNRQES